VTSSLSSTPKKRIFTPLAVFATKAMDLAIPQSLFPREYEVVQ
jgi:hypothetical protein